MKISCRLCEGIMIKRENRKTKNPFYGCSRYPECKSTMTIRYYNERVHEKGCSAVGEHPRDNEYDLGNQ